jgi:hypothetical protein
MLKSFAVAHKILSLISMSRDVCHYIWETFPYVISPTLVFAYIMLIISIYVVTFLHHILTSFALLEYPVLEYALTKLEDVQSQD